MSFPVLVPRPVFLNGRKLLKIDTVLLIYNFNNILFAIHLQMASTSEQNMRDKVYSVYKKQELLIVVFIKLNMDTLREPIRLRMVHLPHHCLSMDPKGVGFS